jgi:tetratricopeptide (TPR) repeat protein
LNEAIKNYDLAINILKPLVEDEGRKELANDLAAAYMNKGNALYSLGSLNEAIKNYDLAINILKPLVEDEGRKELANDLAAAYMNKGVALDSLGSLNEAIKNYDLAINIRKRLVEDEGRKELTDDLAMAFANKANVLAQQEKFKEAADYFDAAANLWMDAVQSGLIHLLPNLMKVIRITVGLLVQIEDWNAAAVKVLHAFSLLEFTMENDIHETIKQNTMQEFTRLLFTLCQTPQENREKIYEACGENAETVREYVEGFCKQTQEQ